MSAECAVALPQHFQNGSTKECNNGSKRLRKNLINSNILNRYMHFNGINECGEGNKDLILYNSQALSIPIIPQLWYNPQPFIPYHFTSPPPQYSQFLPYLFYYSNAAGTASQQKQKEKKSEKNNFWCAGIAQLLWTIVMIIMSGLIATLILTLLVV